MAVAAIRRHCGVQQRELTSRNQPRMTCDFWECLPGADRWEGARRELRAGAAQGVHADAVRRRNGRCLVVELSNARGTAHRRITIHDAFWITTKGETQEREKEKEPFTYMHKIMSYEIFFLIIYSDLAFASRTGSRWKPFEREAAKVLKSRAKFIKMALSFISPRANTRTLVCLVWNKETRKKGMEW